MWFFFDQSTNSNYYFWWLIDLSNAFSMWIKIDVNVNGRRTHTIWRALTELIVINHSCFLYMYIYWFYQLRTHIYTLQTQSSIYYVLILYGDNVSVCIVLPLLFFILLFVFFFFGDLVVYSLNWYFIIVSTPCHNHILYITHTHTLR